MLRVMEEQVRRGPQEGLGLPNQNALSRWSNLSDPQIPNSQVFLTQGGQAGKRREMEGGGCERVLGMSFVIT